MRIDTDPGRLPFVLPDFTRRQWTTPAARLVWEPRLQRIGVAWAEIERESVAMGVRAAHLTSTDPERLPELAAWAAGRGLVLLPLTRNARAVEYSQSARPAGAGEPWDYRVAYVQAARAGEWSAAWAARDDVAMGAMLGYPPCCTAFFQRTWVGASSIDPTWSMAGHGATDQELPERDVRNVDPHAQILGRWAGYRAVPHMPCSWACEPSAAFGRELLQVGRDLGYVEEMAHLLDALSWPYEWSALHGIAEIRSPILRVMTRTDATRAMRTIRVHAPAYPPEGARGTRHPYRTWREHKPTDLVTLKTRSRSARLNGFKSDEVMGKAHGVLVRAAAPAHGEVASILDLGSGDGTLLKRLGKALGAAKLLGVEIDPDRQAGAVDGVEVVRGSVADLELWNDRWDLVVLMPGRVEELPEEAREPFLDALLERAGRLLLYGYGDWLERFGGLSPLVEATIPGAGTMRSRAVESCASAALYTGRGPCRGG